MFLLKHKMDLSQVALVLDLDPQLPQIQADPAQLQQALVALMVNAIDAMPQGGTLTLRTGARSAWVAIPVADTGVGMDDDVKAHIFEPFFTTKQEQGSTSLGLGLAVVYGIVERHRGSISVESAPGQGTVFTILLPSSLKEEQL